MEFGRTITFGDILSMICMVGSVFAAIIAWVKESKSKKYAESANMYYLKAQEYYRKMEPLVELQKEQIERDLRREALVDPEFNKYYKKACEYFDYFRDKLTHADCDYFTYFKYVNIDWDFDSYYEHIFQNEPGLKPLAKRILRELESAKKIQILGDRISICKSPEESARIIVELERLKKTINFGNSQRIKPRNIEDPL